MIFMILAIYSIFFLFDAQSIKHLTHEDGLVESLGAVMFLISSIGFGIVFCCSCYSRNDKIVSSIFVKKDIFCLLLSLFFLLCFLEEISWGQRIFGIETPDMLSQINRQHEINIHNLVWFHGKDTSGNRKSFLKLLLNGDRLFSMFWFGYCVCIPLLAAYNKAIKKFLIKIRFPIIPRVYALLFPLNYVVSRIVTEIHPAYKHNIVETKESIFAVLFACVAFGYVFRQSKDQKMINANAVLSS